MVKFVINITHSELKSKLHYDRNSGIFTWKVNKGRKRLGDVAGFINKIGYWEICINQIQYLGHRLAWFYVYEILPEELIDHINMNRSDNRIENLRQADQSQNSINREIQSNNTSGYRGVSYNKKRKKYEAYCTLNSKTKKLGYYETAEEASIVYEKYAKSIFGEFYNERL